MFLSLAIEDSCTVVLNTRTVPYNTNNIAGRLSYQVPVQVPVQVLVSYTLPVPGTFTSTLVERRTTRGTVLAVLNSLALL
jgi:hypothetical protein